MEDSRKKALNEEELEQVTGGAGLGPLRNNYFCRFCRAHYTSVAECGAHENVCSENPENKTKKND